MKRNWKHGLMCVVTGLCCFATVAEVDAGIIFRRRGTGVTTTQTTTNVTRVRRGILGRRRRHECHRPQARPQQRSLELRL